MIPINKIFESCKTIAVVGISDNPTRASYGVSAVMQQNGFKIIPVNPKYETVLGMQCYPDLNSVEEKIDIVNVFRRPEYVPTVVEQVLKTQAQVLWLQLGVGHRQAEEMARNAGLTVVSNRCIKVDYLAYKMG